jgi:asparagine synthase (glutamine-hydrolysing)
MCGISGFLDTRHVPREVVDEQLRVLAHRGPDATGAFTSSPGTVAQNRLAVIDVETGNPPITNEDASIGVVLNGEIYNYRELRAGLIERGHRFDTTGDTEVIAHLAEEVGPQELASQLDGMFALAVWDTGTQRLTLARDRLGKKPLYYAVSGQTFVFGSEIKAVLAHPSVSRELDPGAIPAYLTFGYVPTPRTFFRGILSLEPGHVLTISPGSTPQMRKYWSPPRRTWSAVTDVTMDAAARGVRQRLETAVQKRLTADVPLGAFLSGGLDSSLIVALMAQASDRPVQTFTIGFDDRDGFDERAFARVVAARYRTDHHQFVVSPNAVELIEKLVWHYDQPFGDSSAIPTYLLNEATRSAVTVALSGDGGDELFAGYERFAAALATERYGRLPPAVRGLVGPSLARLPRSGLRRRIGSAQRFVRSADRGLPDAYLSWLSYFSDETRAHAMPDTSTWAIDDFRERWESTAGQTPLDRLLELNLTTYLVDDLLVKADRMSMAHGLEVRSPFLDTDLLGYAVGLPPELKLRGLSSKRVLKRVAMDLLPREIIHRRKRGFGVPLDRWFRDDLAPYVNGTLGSSDARVRSHLAPAVLERLIQEHTAGTRDHGQALWLLLTLEVFLRREGW